MPEEWTATRIAAYFHRTVFAGLGFNRTGTTCSRTDERLARTIKFYALPATSPRVQILLNVSLVGLPEPLTPSRRDSVWGYPKTRSPGNRYTRPLRQQLLPPELLGDVAGPAVEFLTHAQDLAVFAEWGQQIYAGDPHRGWWRRFQPVMPQGTSPLQAATYAAALMGDAALAARLADKVLAFERN